MMPSTYPVPSGTKMCRKCYEVKPHSYFFAHKGSPDGINSYCKQCCKDIENEKKIKEIKSKLDKKERERLDFIEKCKGKLILCTKCKIEKPIEAYSVAFKHGKVHRHHWCKKCAAKRTQEATIKKLQYFPMQKEGRICNTGI
jgi:hypothetical protein